MTEREEKRDNDLFYLCSLIEYIGQHHLEEGYFDNVAQCNYSYRPIGIS